MLLVMLCGYLDDDVWKVLAELSYFYRHVCAKEIKKDMIEKLEKEILMLIYKLEKNISSRVVESDAASLCSSSI
jgi:hypothetical protein